jgi:hypothetical protein
MAAGSKQPVQSSSNLEQMLDSVIERKGRMHTSRIGLIAAVILALTVVSFSAVQAAPKPSQAMSAIQSAAKQGRYIFITFYKKGDDASQKMLSDLNKVQGKLSSRASFTSVDVNDSANSGVVRRYGVERSPTPLLIVLAPNGAITAGFPNEVPSQAKKTVFSDVFVSKAKADLLKTLQDQKTAAICVQNSRTKHNKESLAAAKGLNKTSPFTGTVRIIQIDPLAKAEAKLLRELKVNTKSPEAQIVVVASSGNVMGRFAGAVTTSKMVAVLKKSPDCSSGGCAPGG